MIQEVEWLLGQSLRVAIEMKSCEESLSNEQNSTLVLVILQSVD